MIYLNGNPLPVTLFPDNTSQVWKLPEHIFDADSNWVHIVWRFEHEGEFMHVAQLKGLLDQYGILASLRLPYLPYGRQDKEISNDSTFALRTFAKLLNTLSFQEVIIVDPHSYVALDEIENSRSSYPAATLRLVMDKTENDLLCYPDKGAREKYAKANNYAFIYGEKVRDQETGNITSYKLIGDPKGMNVLIVDDICDGGATFKLLAKDLLAAGATEVNLFVTHGIFSKGLRTLHESGIKKIFTKDGEMSEIQNNLTYRKI